jgi:hypothetical protein
MHMLREVGLIMLSVCLALATGVVRPQTARALDVQCIEASKYKHLYLIFGNERRRLAQYLRLSEANLPDAEACRAVLVTGPMETRARSRELGQPSDSDKLLQAIAENRGWLATIYLASGGGNIGTGLTIAEITRMFWLKSEAPDRPGFTYWPDFIMRPAVTSGRGEPELTDAVVPPELEEGWKNYVRAVGGFAKSTVTGGRGRCASACTFAHVSAVERRGIVFVHRGRPSPSAADDKSMQELLEQLHRSENRIIALYRTMDGGEEFVRLFQSTPTATTTPAEAARYPRYISDLLRSKCNADTQQLIERELALKGQIDGANGTAGDVAGADRLKAQLTALQSKRSAVERCVAASQEKERLTQFARFCPGACDRPLIESTIMGKLKELEPVSAERGGRERR